MQKISDHPHAAGTIFKVSGKTGRSPRTLKFAWTALEVPGKIHQFAYHIKIMDISNIQKLSGCLILVVATIIYGDGYISHQSLPRQFHALLQNGLHENSK